MALILAGCGGSGSANAPAQVVRGSGFAFHAPAGWSVKGAAATSGKVDRLEVRTFELLKPYRPILFTAASKELDRLAAQLAKELGGTIAKSATVDAAGGKVRSYRIDYGGKVTEVTFVLRGLREYELLCRRDAKSDGAACKQLVASFRIAG